MSRSGLIGDRSGLDLFQKQSAAHRQSAGQIEEVAGNDPVQEAVSHANEQKVPTVQEDERDAEGRQ